MIYSFSKFLKKGSLAVLLALFGILSAHSSLWADHNYPPTGNVSYEVQDVIRQALNQYNTYNRDQVLINGVRVARSVDDIIALAQYCQNSFNKDKILGSGTHLARFSDDIIRLAREMSNDYNRDQILLKGVSYCKGADEIVRLMGETRNPHTKDQLAQAGLDKARDVYEIVQLARTVSNTYTRDQILLKGVKFAHSDYELRFLADATDNSYTKQQILKSYPGNGGGNNGYPGGNNNDFYTSQRAYEEGKIYQDRNNFNAALISYSRGKRYFNQYGALCLYFSGYCNVKVGRYGEAQFDYEQYIRSFPQGTQIEPAHFVLGRVYESLGNTYSARNIYQRLLQLWPYGEYSSRARERLNYLGGHTNFAITPELSEEFKVENGGKESKVDLQNPFEGEEGEASDLVQSIDPEKTDRHFILRLKQKLTFEKVHGNKQAGEFLKELNSK